MSAFFKKSDTNIYSQLERSNDMRCKSRLTSV